MDERAHRIGANEALYREVNERVLELNERFGAGGERVDFVCECGDGACTERIALALEEYERVRADGRRFVVLPGHEQPDVERVVERGDGFFVVEKHEGEAAALAEAADPR